MNEIIIKKEDGGVRTNKKLFVLSALNKLCSKHRLRKEQNIIAKIVVRQHSRDSGFYPDTRKEGYILDERPI